MNVNKHENWQVQNQPTLSFRNYVTEMFNLSPFGTAKLLFSSNHSTKKRAKLLENFFSSSGNLILMIFFK